MENMSYWNAESCERTDGVVTSQPLVTHYHPLPASSHLPNADVQYLQRPPSSHTPLSRSSASNQSAHGAHSTHSIPFQPFQRTQYSFNPTVSPPLIHPQPSPSPTLTHPQQPQMITPPQCEFAPSTSNPTVTQPHPPQTSSPSLRETTHSSFSPTQSHPDPYSPQSETTAHTSTPLGYQNTEANLETLSDNVEQVKQQNSSSTRTWACNGETVLDFGMMENEISSPSVGPIENLTTHTTNMMQEVVEEPAASVSNQLFLPDGSKDCREGEIIQDCCEDSPLKHSPHNSDDQKQQSGTSDKNNTAHHSYKSDTDSYCNISDADHHSYKSDTDSHSYKSDTDHHSYKYDTDHHSYKSDTDHHSYKSDTDSHSYKSDTDHHSYKYDTDHHSYKSDTDHHSYKCDTDHHSYKSDTDSHSYKSDTDHHSYKYDTDHYSYKSDTGHHSYKSISDIENQSRICDTDHHSNKPNTDCHSYKFSRVRQKQSYQDELLGHHSYHSDRDEKDHSKDKLQDSGHQKGHNLVHKEEQVTSHSQHPQDYHNHSSKERQKRQDYNNTFPRDYYDSRNSERRNRGAMNDWHQYYHYHQLWTNYYYQLWMNYHNQTYTDTRPQFPPSSTATKPPLPTTPPPITTTTPPPLPPTNHPLTRTTTPPPPTQTTPPPTTTINHTTPTTNTNDPSTHYNNHITTTSNDPSTHYNNHTTTTYNDPSTHYNNHTTTTSNDPSTHYNNHTTTTSNDPSTHYNNHTTTTSNYPSTHYNNHTTTTSNHPSTHYNNHTTTTSNDPSTHYNNHTTTTSNDPSTHYSNHTTATSNDPSTHYNNHTTTTTNHYNNHNHHNTTSCHSPANNIVNDMRENTSQPQYITPLHFSRPHILARFTPTGQLIVVPGEGEQATVQVRDTRKMLEMDPTEAKVIQQMKHFPGPLTRHENTKHTVLKYCEQQVNEATLNSSLNDHESVVLLWQYLARLVRYNGYLCGSDIAELLMQGRGDKEGCEVSSDSNGEVSSQNSGEISRQNSGEISSKNSEKISSKNSQDKGEVGKFTNLLCLGNKHKALDTAMKEGLWGHAFILANKMDSKTFNYVQAAFMDSVSHNDVLQTLHQHLSCRTPKITMSYTQDAWGDWQQHIAIMLSNPSCNAEQDRASLITMGDTLAQQGRLHAAYFCYLVSDVTLGTYKQKDSKLVLLGASHSLPVKSFTTNEAIQCAEVYEYALGLDTNKNPSLPTFQEYKLLYALRLAERGFLDDALRYCEVIGDAMIREPSQYGPELVSRVIDLFSRLKYHVINYQEGDGDDGAMPDPQWIIKLRATMEHMAVPQHEGVNVTHDKGYTEQQVTPQYTTQLSHSNTITNNTYTQEPDANHYHETPCQNQQSYLYNQESNHNQTCYYNNQDPNSIQKFPHNQEYNPSEESHENRDSHHHESHVKKKDGSDDGNDDPSYDYVPMLPIQPDNRSNTNISYPPPPQQQQDNSQPNYYRPQPAPHNPWNQQLQPQQEFLPPQPDTKPGPHDSRNQSPQQIIPPQKASNIHWPTQLSPASLNSDEGDHCDNLTTQKVIQPKTESKASHTKKVERGGASSWFSFLLGSDVIIDITAPSTDKTEEMDWTDPSTV
ncbi:hypothetical protein Pcinc_033251 [Petrolisthes cinctipes]|uniref:Protein transport protein sec16 n=1 Tax=Petrolisthes cinctipes TaxID=88211 RepID=A0AAE1K241_PETCI|nr:hypothetical protein Pcinc_033251 [Petrolisthes cinctipes]